MIRRGYVVAEWGPTDRVDMTFSVTKTFLSTIVGLAWQQGAIKDVQARLRDDPRMPRLFDSEHNAAITWDHLLRQTSDWQGTLWGKPDWADRPEGDNPADWPNRKMSAPGTRYKYNDVRVNVLALCALPVWQRPLPDVLREQVMGPIGASDTWRWHGYETFRGNGQNIVYIDWDNDLVVVVRWIRGGDALDTFLGKVLASIVDAG